MKEEEKNKTEICACAACNLPVRDVDTVQKYLTDLLGRHLDTEYIVEMLSYNAASEKNKLVTEGKDFVYQQATIDFALILRDFLSGKRKFSDFLKIAKEEEVARKKQVQNGMEVG